MELASKVLYAILFLTLNNYTESASQQQIENLLRERAKKKFKIEHPETEYTGRTASGDCESDSLNSGQQFDLLEQNWEKYGSQCNYTKHRNAYIWFLTVQYVPAKQFWQSIVEPSFAKGVCNFFKYQHCHPVSNTCECFAPGIYNGDGASKECELIEASSGCGKWYKDEPFYSSKEACESRIDYKEFLDLEMFKYQCQKESNCDSLTCGPITGKTNYPSLKAFIKSNFQKLERAPWIPHAKKCQIHKNYDFKKISQLELKENITSLYYDDFLEVPGEIDMCNPFTHTGCHPKTLKCTCLPGFALQEKECRLAPGYYCEWELKVPYLINEENAKGFVPEKVQVKCVENAECMNDKCICQDGMQCADEDDVSGFKNTGNSRHNSKVIIIFTVCAFVLITLHF